MSHRIGVLCNPLAGRVRGRLERLRRLARELPGGLYREADGLPAIADVMKDFAASGIDTLVVIAGDGTAHAVMGQLLGGAFERLPVVAVVPAGTTNMTAADLGVRGPPERVLRQLLAQLSEIVPGRMAARRVLRIESPRNSVLHGMFFGTGLISAGVRYFDDHVRRLGVTGEKASGLVMLRFTAALLLGKGRRPTASRVVRLVENGVDARAGAMLLMLATTLDRLLLGTKPYWGVESAPIHATAITQSPRRLWRSLPGILAGRGGVQGGEADYHSRNLNSLELEMDGEFVVDGQLYSGAGGAVRITAADTLRFLTPAAGRRDGAP